MLKNLTNKFVKEEDGGLFEYLILIAIAALIAVLLIPSLRSNLVSWFNTAVSNVTKAISGKSGASSAASESTATPNVQW